VGPADPFKPSEPAGPVTPEGPEGPCGPVGPGLQLIEFSETMAYGTDQNCVVPMSVKLEPPEKSTSTFKK
jgi:hypothetical protein